MHEAVWASHNYQPNDRDIIKFTMVSIIFGTIQWLENTGPLLCLETMANTCYYNRITLTNAP